jgi:hypothetical protein
MGVRELRETQKRKKKKKKWKLGKAAMVDLARKKK